LALPEGLKITPGQFFMIRTTPGFDPLLRRPFGALSITDLNDSGQKGLSILFRDVGQGTHLMAEWSKGRDVDMLGPLGKGFTRAEGSRRLVLIAGGLGIASLYGLAESVFRSKNRPEVYAYIGGKSKRDILMKSEMETMGVQVHVTTEDGSMGTRGMITDWLRNEGSHLEACGNAAVYACGPLEMLAKVAKITQDFSLPCEVSLEARMACGVGSCLGCAVNTLDRGYRMACKDGPVFDANEIDWKRIKRLL
jgi:dihydroorotate dehydrogenase electron transfer subunit